MTTDRLNPCMIFTSGFFWYPFVQIEDIFSVLKNESKIEFYFIDHRHILSLSQFQTVEKT